MLSLYAKSEGVTEAPTAEDISRRKWDVEEQERLAALQERQQKWSVEEKESLMALREREQELEVRRKQLNK